MKYTKHFLKKIEDLLTDLEYTIRYERGNFKSGYCIVEDRRIAVINRFFETEARINVLIEILGTIKLDDIQLDEKQAALYKSLMDFSREEDLEKEESTPVEETTPPAEVVQTQLEVNN